MTVYLAKGSHIHPNLSKWRLRLPAGWLIYALFLFYPIWWLLGLDGIIWPVLIFLPALKLILRGRGRVVYPKGFFFWLLFVAWMLLSAIQLEGEGRGLAFLYRASLYVSSTAFFLYVYNSSLPDRTFIKVIIGFWSLAALGGLLALALPNLSFQAPASHLLSQSLLSNNFVYVLFAKRSLADVQAFLGYPVPRPKTFFPYTNSWGSNVTLLLPFVFVSLSTAKSRLGRFTLVVLIGLFVVPFIFSLNRGAWLSLGMSMLYVVVRLALARRLRTVVNIGIIAIVLIAVIVLSPFDEVFWQRLETPHSNVGRMLLYQEAVERSLESPLFGYGAPRPSENNPNLPSVGTHSQILLVLFSHGIPGLALFVLWWLYAFFQTGGRLDVPEIWYHTVLLIVIVQSAYYELLPMQIHIAMMAAALALRHKRAAALALRRR